jgi:thimet oligopeptidase
VWHEDVTLFDVFDAASGAPMGQFYLDLHPRKGKYGHAAVFGLIAGCQKSADERQLPVAGMVCNFPKPTKDAKDATLPHSDVVTFFHEFGHVMHQLCTKVKYAKFAGTAVERDFVEAPSQMLENWCYEEEALKVSRRVFLCELCVSMLFLVCILGLFS